MYNKMRLQYYSCILLRIKALHTANKIMLFERARQAFLIIKTAFLNN